MSTVHPWLLRDSEFQVLLGAVEGLVLIKKAIASVLTGTQSVDYNTLQQCACQGTLN